MARIVNNRRCGSIKIVYIIWRQFFIKKTNFDYSYKIMDKVKKLLLQAAINHGTIPMDTLKRLLATLCDAC